MERLVALLICALAFVCQAADPAYTAKVVGVHDGDSLTVYDGTNPAIKIRLASIDAPELGQPYGKQAKADLAALVFGKQVSVSPHGKDRYGRTLADIRVSEVWVNLRMVETGSAWRYDNYSKDPILLAAQQRAAKAGLALWSMPGPVPPWLWRKEKSSHALRKI